MIQQSVDPEILFLKMSSGGGTESDEEFRYQGSHEFAPRFRQSAESANEGSSHGGGWGQTR